MQIAAIELYELLKAKIGEKEAKSLVAFVEAEVEQKIEQKKEQFISITDKEKLLTKADAIEIFASKKDLAESKADIIKWMFIFFAGQIGLQTGIIIAVL